MQIRNEVERQVDHPLIHEQSYLLTFEDLADFLVLVLGAELLALGENVVLDLLEAANAVRQRAHTGHSIHVSVLVKLKEDLFELLLRQVPVLGHLRGVFLQGGRYHRANGSPGEDVVG